MNNGKLLSTYRILYCEEFKDDIIRAGRSVHSPQKSFGISINETDDSEISIVNTLSNSISKAIETDDREISIGNTFSRSSSKAREIIKRKTIETIQNYTYDDVPIKNYYAEVDSSSERDCWGICNSIKFCVASMYLCKRCFLFDQTLKRSLKDSFKVFSKIDLNKAIATKHTINTSRIPGIYILSIEIDFQIL